MAIAPDWHHDLRVPTVGDDIVIRNADVITIEHERQNPSAFRLSIQPRPKIGEMSDHARALGVLVQTGVPKYPCAATTGFSIS